MEAREFILTISRSSFAKASQDKSSFVEILSESMGCGASRNSLANEMCHALIQFSAAVS
jgi:hypothetical protein